MTDLKKNKENQWIMLVTFIFFSLLHSTFVGFTNDDSYFQTLPQGFHSLLELLVHRYETDSSRVLSEAFLFTFVQLPFFVWQIADVLICMLLFYSLKELVVRDNVKTDYWMVFLGFAMYPFMHVGSAGWICTSLNYLWPLATLLYTLTLAKKRQQGERVPVYSYVLAVLAFLFTANCEMSAALLVMLYVVAALYAFFEKRKAGYEITGIIFGLAGIIFAFSAPGNDERTLMEAENWMPEFFDLSFWEKARLCSVFVFEHFVAIPDVIFFLFALLLVIVGLPKAKKAWQKVLVVLPVGVDVLFTGYYFIKDFLIGRKTSYDFSYPAIYMEDTATKLLQLSEVAGLLLFIVGAVYGIWLICLPADVSKKPSNPKEFFLTYKKGIWCIWTLACGFAVRMALMLSPTMFSSWHRTLIFMYFAFLYNCFVLLQDGKILEKKGWLRACIIVLMVIGVIVNLILTVGLQIRKAG